MEKTIKIELVKGINKNGKQWFGARNIETKRIVSFDFKTIRALFNIDYQTMLENATNINKEE